jgi:DNA-directed RNA polymerase specialized sigma24 family protein
MFGRIFQSSRVSQSEAISIARSPENVSYCALQTCGRHPSTQLVARRPYPRMELTQESFDLLLSWLHPVPDEAGKIYVKIRAGLIRNFVRQRCPVPDELADITVDRVAKLLPKLIDTYVGEKERYFHRVAYYVLREYWSRTIETVELEDDMPVVEPDKDYKTEAESHCLDKCMARLPVSKREFIKKYYYGNKGEKIRQRKELAASHNLALAALRVKALRIRRGLKNCTNDCMATLDII